MITKLEIYGVVLIVVLLAAFGWGEHKKKEGITEERGRWELKVAQANEVDLKALKDAVAQGNAIATETKDAVGKIKVVNITRQGVIEREIKTDVRYVNDCFPESGRLQWNAISAGRPVLPSVPSGQPSDGVVPNAVQPRSSGQQGRNTPVKPQRSQNNLR